MMAKLSNLDYARQHGLIRDYTLLSPFDSNFISRSSSEDFDTADSTDLSSLEIPPTHVLDERLNIDENGAKFLCSALSMIEPLPVRDYPTRRAERRHIRLPSPLLSTDPDLDLAKLFPKPETQSLLTVSLGTFVPSQPDNDLLDNEERLSWPASDPSLIDRAEGRIQHEKLGITIEASQYLKSITHSEPLQDDESCSDISKGMVSGKISCIFSHQAEYPSVSCDQSHEFAPTAAFNSFIGYWRYPGCLRHAFHFDSDRSCL